VRASAVDHAPAGVLKAGIEAEEANRDGHHESK